MRIILRLALSAWFMLCAAGCHAKPPDPRIARGEALYQKMCAVCHGERGEGYRADEAPRLAQPGWLASASDAFLREAIVQGRTGSTMSAWGKERGGPLTGDDVSALIQFLRTWQQRPSQKLDESLLRGNTERGNQLYQAQCVGCHGARGVGGRFVRIGNPEFLRTASNGYLRFAISAGRPDTQMPAYGQTMSPDDIDSLVHALRAFQAPPPPPPVHPPPPRAQPLPLGPVPIHPKGPEPVGFKAHPAMTSVDVVKNELARGARLGILDARAPSDYISEHISGAVSVPFYDPTPYISKLPKNTWLVCYCACPHAESGQLAQKLFNAGFKKVTVLDEGFNVWRSRKYPTTQGEKP